MFPVYFENDNRNIIVENRFDLAFNYITTAIGSALLNRFVSYLFEDKSDEEVDTHDLSLSMAEKGEYNKTVKQKSIEDIVERGEYYEYKVL
jgi:hypothetical protein